MLEKLGEIPRWLRLSLIFPLLCLNGFFHCLHFLKTYLFGVFRCAKKLRLGLFVVVVLFLKSRILSFLFFCVIAYIL